MLEFHILILKSQNLKPGCGEGCSCSSKSNTQPYTARMQSGWNDLQAWLEYWGARWLTEVDAEDFRGPDFRCARFPSTGASGI